MRTPLRAKVLAQKRSERYAIDPIAVWSISFGAVAVIFASLVYFEGSDKFAASFVLVAAAAIIAVILFGAAPEQDGT
jgi:membrane protein YdbS with pleckstrin-like domain